MKKKLAVLVPEWLWPTVGLVATALRVLRRDGARAFAREVRLRLLARLRYDLPLTSPASYIRLNIDYSNWLHARSLKPVDIGAMRARAESFSYRPVISILVPVYNTPQTQLVECIESVLAQVYDAWELCIVDDGSTRAHVRPLLQGYLQRDPRIQVRHLKRNVGISAASGQALDMAVGEFVALLDHDDELTPDALFEVVALLNSTPDRDLIYSDEDKRAARGTLVEPFFKPGWSPDLLRCMNYITHLSVLRTSVVRDVGGFRPGFDGSQDYDLLLRVTETTDRIAHIPHVLYHWRKTPGSAALHANAKPYAYVAGVMALKESLERRHWRGSVTPSTPGHYTVRYEIGVPPPVAILALGSAPNVLHTQYSDLEVIVGDDLLALASDSPPRAEFLVICDGRIKTTDPDWIYPLLEHAQRPEVGAAGPVLVDEAGAVLAAGLFVGVEGGVQPAFGGWDLDDSSPYSGVLQSARNCSALSGCMTVRRSVLEQVLPDQQFQSPASELLDLSLRLREAGFDIVCVPDVRVQLAGGLRWREDDWKALRDRWSEQFSRRDPFLNPNVSMTSDGVRINPAALG